MDPLSALASAVTLSVAVSASLHQLQALHSADRELQAIANEVSDIQVVYSALGESIEERQAHKQLSQDHLCGLSTLLESSNRTLTVLDTLIKDRLIRARTPDGEPKAIRLAWLRQRNRVKGLLEELRSTRISISALWGAAHLSDLSRIQLRLDAFEGFHGTYNEVLVRQSQYLETISERICEQRLLAAPDPSDSPNQSTSNSSDSSLTLTSQNSVNVEEQSLIIPRHLDDEQSPLEKTHTYNTVRIRASRYRRSQCEGWCSCSCHQVNYFRTPQGTESAFGSIFIGFSAFPLQQQRCSEKNCQKQSIPTLKVTYHFPQWLIARMISFALSLTYMNGPQVSLHMPRVVDGNSEIFNLAVQGNISGVKKLFKDGLASPYDVAASNGRTALHYAVNYSHQEMSQFLIDLGADPSLEDKEQASTITLAWGRMFGSLVRRSTIDAWRCLFDDEDHLESRAFPPLHKIVLGLALVDLNQQLDLSSAGIDDRDADGRTALSWAATRGDLKSVSSLLQYRADPNVTSLRGQTALHWASQNPTAEGPRILQALIDAGSDVNAVDYWKRTGLIYASCNQDDPRVLEVLVNGGARIDFQDCHQRTSLGYAAKMGKFKGLQYLLSAGGDATLSDAWGCPPLFEAVQHNHHSSLQGLIQHTPIPLAKDINGSSALHVAALYGDVKTMALLEHGDLKQLDSTALDKNGMSAQDLLNQREDLTTELRVAFQRLTLGTRVNTATSLGPQSSGSERADGNGEGKEVEEFVDAFEYLDIGENGS